MFNRQMTLAVITDSLSTEYTNETFDCHGVAVVGVVRINTRSHLDLAVHYYYEYGYRIPSYQTDSDIVAQYSE